MKDFNKLTEKEMILLTNEQLEKYVNLELANQGIPFLDIPKEPEYEKIEEPDLVLYSNSVLNLYSIDESVIKEINIILFNNKHNLKQTGYEYGKSKIEFCKKDLKENSWDDADITFKIINKTVYSDELYYKIKTIVDRNAKKVTNHDENMIKWENIQNDINVVQKDIYDIYDKAISEKYKLDVIKYKYNEYLKLSDNNKDIAINFLKKAYKITPEIEKELKK